MTVVINGTTGITNPNSMTIGNGGGSVATNTAVGASALAANTTGGGGTAFGYNALAANTTANQNSAFGTNALAANTTGLQNAGFGRSALAANTTGGSNTAVGTDALISNTTASYNTAVGYQAAYSNTVAGYTVAIGYQAGYNYNRTADANNGYNTFVGPFAGYYCTTGRANTILGGYNGNQGGLDIRTNSNYIVLSDGDGNPRGVFSSAGVWCVGPKGYTGGTTAIGCSQNQDGTASARVTQTNNEFYTYDMYNSSGTNTMDFRWNNLSVGSIRVSSTATSYQTSSDYRLKDVHGLVEDATPRLRAIPVYRLNYKAEPEVVMDAFLAHEVQSQADYAVSGVKDATVDVGDIRDADGNIVKSSCRQPAELPEGHTWTYVQTVGQWQQVDYSKLVPLLTASLQDAWNAIDLLKAEIAALKGQA